MSEKAKCPFCHVTIEHLEVKEYGTDFVNESVTRYGESDLYGDDIEISDSECNESDTRDSETDEVNYYCPECDHSIDPEELEILGEDNACHRIPSKPNPIIENSELISNGSFYCSKNLVFFVCVHCETKVEVLGSDDGASSSGKSRHGEREVRCTKCNRRITAKNAKQIIKV